MRGKIVNSFYDGSESGFGDFLRGSIHLYEVSKSFNLDFDIDISHHPINEFISSDYGVTYPKSDIKCLTKEIKKNSGDTNFYKNCNQELFERLTSIKNNEVKYVFSNFSFLNNIKEEAIIDFVNEKCDLSDDCCSWFQKKLSFSPSVADSVKSSLQSENIKDYDLIHFRIGDKVSFLGGDDHDGPTNEECFYICKKEFEHRGSNLPMVVISDSNKLKSYIKTQAKKYGFPFYVFHTSSGHMQNLPSSVPEGGKAISYTKANLFYAAFDMKLVSMAKTAKSYSVYSWGSGFLAWVAKIYKVPCFLNPFPKLDIGCKKMISKRFLF